VSTHAPDPLAVVRAYLREHFPAGRLEEPATQGATHRIDVVTNVRRYRLFVAADLLATESGDALAARCHAEAVAWRLADTGRLLLTRAGATRPAPDFDG